MPDSPTLSPIELKQELPKYLPALQVRRPAAQPGSASPVTAGPVAESRSQVLSAVVFHQRGPGPPLLQVTGQAQAPVSMSMVQPFARQQWWEQLLRPQRGPCMAGSLVTGHLPFLTLLLCRVIREGQ